MRRDTEDAAESTHSALPSPRHRDGACTRLPARRPADEGRHLATMAVQWSRPVWSSGIWRAGLGLLLPPLPPLRATALSITTAARVPCRRGKAMTAAELDARALALRTPVTLRSDNLPHTAKAAQVRPAGMACRARTRASFDAGVPANNWRTAVRAGAEPAHAHGRLARGRRGWPVSGPAGGGSRALSYGQAQAHLSSGGRCGRSRCGCQHESRGVLRTEVAPEDLPSPYALRWWAEGDIGEGAACAAPNAGDPPRGVRHAAEEPAAQALHGATAPVSRRELRVCSGDLARACAAAAAEDRDGALARPAPRDAAEAGRALHRR